MLLNYNDWCTCAVVPVVTTVLTYSLVVRLVSTIYCIYSSTTHTHV